MEETENEEEDEDSDSEESVEEIINNIDTSEFKPGNL